MKRAAGAIVGIVFGVTLSWTGMTSPEVLRHGLLFEKSYLYLFFASAVLTSFVGLRLVRGRRALITKERVDWTAPRPQARHIYGSVIFGVGWAVADACPGPIATQLGQGIWWSVFTLAGTLIGVRLFLRRQPDTEPARETRTAAAHA
jgi:uncharacterized membrane protein YedE/YeeE